MTKVKRPQATLVLLAALLTASVACAAPSAPQSILVSAVVGEAVSAVEELTETAFDRLDASMSLAASQARAVVSHAAAELAHVASHTLDELDDQERRLVSDLQRLTREIEATMGRVAEGVLEPVRQDVFLLLSGDAGYLSASGGQARRGAEELSFELKGTALSRAELLDYQVSSESATPQIRKRDDTRIALTVSLVEGVGADLIARSDPEAILQIPVTFKLEECSWFGLVCRPTRAFVLAGAVLPEELGVARALFSGDMLIEGRKSRTVDHFPRVEVKSGMFGGSETKTETFNIHPTRTPWKIDVESFEGPAYRVSDHCRSGRSRADIQSATADLVRVKALLSHKLQGRASFS